MAKRNPLNQRYKKDTQIGSTRKSAAAAKLKGAGTSSSASKTKKTSAWKRAASASKTSSASNRGRVELPPELKKLQKISFTLLGIAFVISLVYLLQAKALAKTSWASIMLGVAYALMFVALYIDFFKVRPWIKANRDAGKK